jgi:hypothetical protein
MGYTVTDNGSDYDRGHAAGEISERLREHDHHFMRINGSMEKVATRLGDLILQVQRLADAAEADRQTVVTTAAALKDADAARRDSSETRWSPLMRLGIATGVLAALASVLAIVLANFHLRRQP